MPETGTTQRDRGQMNKTMGLPAEAPPAGPIVEALGRPLSVAWTAAAAAWLASDAAGGAPRKS